MAPAHILNVCCGSLKVIHNLSTSVENLCIECIQSYICSIGSNLPGAAGAASNRHAGGKIIPGYG
jgi:hypothetical protein